MNITKKYFLRIKIEVKRWVFVPSIDALQEWEPWFNTNIADLGTIHWGQWEIFERGYGS